MDAFMQECKEIVRGYYLEVCEIKISKEEIFLVWVNKTLQNKKAILGTKIDNTLFEITLNGDKHEIYVDAYKKVKNYKLKC